MVVVGLVTKSCPTLATPLTVIHKAPLFMGFPRQEYWSGLPFLSPFCEVYEVLKEMRKYNNNKRILLLKRVP